MRYMHELSRQRSVAIAIVFLTTAFASLRASGQSNTPTNIQVNSTYVQPTVTRLGINLGDQDYYDSGQLLKNLVFGNAGFEGMKYRSVLYCVAVTANTCTDNNIYSPQPTGFWKGGTYSVISGAQLGVSGSIVASTQGASPYSGSGPQIITFDKNVPLAVGDYVTVTNSFPGDAQEGWGTSLSGAATMTTDTTDLSPETPGKQALQITATGTNDSAALMAEWDTMSGHTFIQMNGAYQLSFRAKGIGGTNQVSIMVSRLLTNEAPFLKQTITLTPAWADYNLTFSADETGNPIGPNQLLFTLAHSGMLIDDVSLTQTNSDPTNTTAFRDDVVNTLKALRPGTLRMNTTESVGADLYDQMAVPFARYREGAFTAASTVWQIPYGITEFLQLCAAVGADPWLSIPTATTPQEMTALMDYMQGDGSTTYSAIRVAAGQTAPWTSVFNTIHIELGNETWNYGFQGDTMVAPAYPLWANQVFGAARNSPGFNPAKFDLILSGFAADPAVTQTILKYSTQHDSIDIAPYLANTVNTEPMTNMFQDLFAEPEFVDGPGGTAYQNMMYANQSTTSASGTAKPTKLHVYEENMGTFGGTITQAESNQFVPSVGGGIALADHMLQLMRLGVATQNTYELPGYINTASNGNTVQIFGMVVDMGTNNLRRPTFLGEALANTAIQGSMLSTVQTGANPTWVQPLTPDGVQLSAAHYIQSFAFLNGTAHSLVLFNLSTSSSLPVTFSGPNAPSGSVQVSQLTSANITDSNETSDTVQTATTTANISSSTPYVLPPYSMTVLSWSGADALTGVAQASAPVFSLTPGTYTSQQTLTLSDSTPGSSIYYTTDGSTPTTSSTLYTGPITLALSKTIQAIGVAPLYTNSAVATASYTIQVQTLNFSGGFAASKGQMILNGSAALSGSGLLLTNGQLNVSGSAWYSVPANIQSFTTDFTFQQTNATANGFTFTIQNQGTSANGMWGSGMGYEYITPSVAVKFDLFNAGGEGIDSTGIFTNGAIPTVPSVNLASTGINLHSGDVMDAHIVYNGTTLTLTITDTVTKATYTTNFTINIPAVIGANSALVGFTGGTGQATAVQNILAWTFTAGGQTIAPIPTFSVAPGTYTTAQTVTITDATPGAIIYYTTNGTTPTTSSTVYTAPITVSSTETLEAIAVLPASTTASTALVKAAATALTATAATAATTTSPVATATYTIAPLASTPSFSVASGTYTTSQTVTISDSTPGAVIYYTTNGSTPTTSSTKYTGALTVGSTETVEAIAVATGYTNSGAGTATYTIQAASTGSTGSTGTSSGSTTGTLINLGSGFSSAGSQIAVNGSAKLSGSSLVLTNGGQSQAGSGWYATPVNVQSFTTDFTFKITNPLADGFTFTIQSAGKNALGGLGQGLGYSYIQNSIGIKFDLYNNAGEGPDSTGLYTDGAMPEMPSINLTPTGINLHSGDTMAVHLVYNGTNLVMTITDKVTNASYTTGGAINIPATVKGNTAYVGFTGGTGGLSATQSILTWTYSH